jgi:hypothetical protein
MEEQVVLRPTGCPFVPLAPRPGHTDQIRTQFEWLVGVSHAHVPWARRRELCVPTLRLFSWHLLLRSIHVFGTFTLKSQPTRDVERARKR